MSIIAPMASDGDMRGSATDPSEPPSSSAEGAGPSATAADTSSPGDERSAAEDLNAGLDLMMRAARKALKNMDSLRIEELGRRAMRSVEHLDRKKVTEFGKKAAQNLDPRKIEEVAEEAGRELLGVIERVAERVEDMLGNRPPGKSGGPEGGEAESADPKRHVRVDDQSG